MQMQSTYWLEKVLKMICLYVNALLCTLQHIVIYAMQLSGVNSAPQLPDLSTCDFYLWDYLKGKVYANSPKTLEDPKKNIRTEILRIYIYMKIGCE